MKIKSIIESRICWLRGPQDKHFTPISEIIIVKINMQGWRKSSFSQFWQIDEVIKKNFAQVRNMTWKFQALWPQNGKL